jgi:hypothetical protein
MYNFIVCSRDIDQLLEAIARLPKSTLDIVRIDTQEMSGREIHSTDIDDTLSSLGSNFWVLHPRGNTLHISEWPTILTVPTGISLLSNVIKEISESDDWAIVTDRCIKNVK